jgi:hypothetical protein
VHTWRKDRSEPSPGRPGSSCAASDTSRARDVADAASTLSRYAGFIVATARVERGRRAGR